MMQLRNTDHTVTILNDKTNIVYSTMLKKLPGKREKYNMLCDNSMLSGNMLSDNLLAGNINLLDYTIILYHLERIA
jgi:hypothetical protein